MAFGNCSLVRRMQEMAFMAGIDHWLWRSACSYALMAPSRSPINSVRLPGRALARADLIEEVEMDKPHTDLDPDLLVQRGNLLGRGHRRTLVALRLQGDMAIDLWMSRDGAMMWWRHSSWRRRLGMGHDAGVSPTLRTQLNRRLVPTRALQAAYRAFVP